MFFHECEHPRIFNIEAATKKDLHDILRLEREAFHPGIEEWSKKDFIEEFELRPEGIKVARIGKKVVGYIQFGQDDPDLQEMQKEIQENSGYIGSIAVFKKYHKNGIGEFLLQTAIDALKSKNVPTIFARTRCNNMEMQNLLLKMGFKKFGETYNYYGLGQNSINLELKTHLNFSC